MPFTTDRRKRADQPDDEALSPEYLAMLVVCGGEVRTEDRAALREAGERRYGRRKDDLAGPPAGGDRRG